MTHERGKLIGLKGRFMGRGDQSPVVESSVPTERPVLTPRIDTNSAEIRWQRIQNQAEVERNIDDFTGQPFLERFANIRRGIFKGIANVGGDPVDVWRINELLEKTEYPHVLSESIDEYMLAVGGLVDTLAQDITDLPLGQQSQAAIRLGSIIATLLSPIHPHKDGNQQNTKVTVLSYLREFNADMDSEGNRGFFSYLSWIDFPITAELTAPVTISQGVLRREVSQRFKEYNFEHEGIEIRKSQAFPFETMFAERRLDRKYTQAEQKLFKQIIREYSTIIAHGYERVRQEQVEGNVEYLLCTPEGQAFLSDFVLHGDERDIHSPDMIVYQSVDLSVLRKVANTIAGTLESKELHDEIFSNVETNWRKLFQIRRIPPRDERGYAGYGESFIGFNDDSDFL